MAKDEIIIKFKPEGDEKLIRAINKLATAQGKLNNQSEKARRQFSKVNATALKLIGSFKSNEDAIKKLGLSQKILTKALRGNSDAVALVTARFKVYTGEMKRAKKHTRILGGTIAVLRSKLLVLTFAIGTATRSVMSFIRVSGDLNEVQNKFDVVFKESSESVGAFIDNLAESTGRSSFQLKDLASNIGSILIPMGASAEQTAKMSTGLAQVAVDMSSLKNIRVADVLRDFSSAMVGNSETVLKYGINVKEGALQTQAFKLGITDSVRQLSEGEKVLTRFKTIVQQSAVAEGDAVRTKHEFNNALQEAGATTEKLKKAIGDVLLPFATGVLNIFNDFNIKRIAAYSVALVGVAASLTKVRTAFKSLSLAFIANPFGALIVAGLALVEVMGLLDSKTEETTQSAMSYQEILESVNGQIGENIKLTQDQVNVIKDQLKVIEDNEASLQLELDMLFAKNEIQRRLIGLGRDFSAEERKLITLIVAKKEQLADEVALKKRVAQANKDLIKSNQNLFNTYQNDLKAGIDEATAAKARFEASELRLLEINKESLGITSQQIAQAVEMSQAEDKLTSLKERLLGASQEEAKGLIIAIGRQEKYIENLKIIKDRTENVTMSNTEMARATGRAFSQMSQAGVSLAKGNKEQTIAALQLGKAQGIANIYIGATQAIKANGLLGVLEGLVVVAQGMASIQNINQQIAAARAVPVAETGGLVGGRRHSQGGTLIEAEQGEFIMSRNAVQAVGIETMNRINQGGGAGNINISFTGNVMSQDFIEDEAIPMIKEAIRRGADIGVS